MHNTGINLEQLETTLANALKGNSDFEWVPIVDKNENFRIVCGYTNLGGTWPRYFELTGDAPVENPNKIVVAVLAATAVLVSTEVRDGREQKYICPIFFSRKGSGNDIGGGELISQSVKHAMKSIKGGIEKEHATQ